MAKKLLSRQGGFVHDIGVVSSLSDEPNNIRLLSDRSLYILQNLSQVEITYLSRYGEILTGDFYLPVLAGSPEESDVQDAIDIMRRDLNSMGVEELLECICANLTDISEEAGASGICCDAKGSSVSRADIQTPPVFGEGEQFPNEIAYLDAKCTVANGIFDTVEGAVTWLKENSVAAKLGLFGGLTTALILALSGPVGWAVMAADAVLSLLVVYFFANAFIFLNMQNALADTKADCINALYSAPTATIAREEFLSALEASTVPVTAIELQLVRLMLPGDAVNQLFVPREDVVAYEPPSPIACVAAGCNWVWRDLPEGGQAGAGDLGKNRTVTLNSTYSALFDLHYIRFAAMEVVFRDCTLEFTVNSVSFDEGDLQHWQVYSDPTTFIDYPYAQIGDAARCSAGVDLAVNVFWSMNITFVDSCP